MLILQINGQNFGPTALTASITVNGFPCTVVSWDHYAVYCRAPMGQGINMPIVLTTLSGVAPVPPATLLTRYTPPAVTTITPTLGDTIGGALLTISGTNFVRSHIFFFFFLFSFDHFFFLSASCRLAAWRSCPPKSMRT